MQAKPEYLDQLIDRASKAAGSDYKLAQKLGVTRQNVSNWKHGKQTCPVADQALMAELAGLPAEEWLSRAVVAQYSGTPKGEALAKALGKALAVTGAGIASSGAHAVTAAGETLSYFIRCICCMFDNISNSVRVWKKGTPTLRV